MYLCSGKFPLFNLPPELLWQILWYSELSFPEALDAFRSKSILHQLARWGCNPVDVKYLGIFPELIETLLDSKHSSVFCRPEYVVLLQAFLPGLPQGRHIRLTIGSFGDSSRKLLDLLCADGSLNKVIHMHVPCRDEEDLRLIQNLRIKYPHLQLILAVKNGKVLSKMDGDLRATVVHLNTYASTLRGISRRECPHLEWIELRQLRLLPSQLEEVDKELRLLVRKLECPLPNVNDSFRGFERALEMLPESTSLHSGVPANPFTAFGECGRILANQRKLFRLGTITAGIVFDYDLRDIE